MPVFSHSAPTQIPAAAEPATKRWRLRSRAEIATRIAMLVLIGSLIAGWGIWEVLRVLSESD
jgi:hypothetical protein